LTRAAAAERGQSSTRLADRIKALYQITSELLAVSDTDELCVRLIDMIFEVLPADRCALLFNDENGQLVQRVLRTRPGHDPDGFAPSRTITRKVARDNLAVLSMDATMDDRFATGQSVFMQSIRAVMCAPVSSVQKVFGVAYLDTVATGGSFDESDLDFLVAVCRQAAMALEKLHLLDEQKKTFESMVRAFAHSIDARDEMTAGHSSRVAKYSQAIARYMGMERADCKRVWYAGLLHDLGKIGTREAVLCKDGALTPEEYEHIKEHPRHTLKILSAINFTADMADIPRVASSHHERIDGAGYPFGWKGDEIPLGGRIIAVADFFDALTARRHYREPMPLDEVIALMEKGRDSQFDAVVLDAFRQYFSNEYEPGARRTAARKTTKNSG
ncbi:MAG: HD domain-containing phosphohydrolase, partial [Deltaproteobacteria bacterium]